MPSSDSWTANATLKQASADGRIRSWVRTPNYGALPKDDKPVNSYSDRQNRVSQDRRVRTIVTGGGTTTDFNGYFYTNADIAALVNSYLDTYADFSDAKLAWLVNDTKVKALVKIADVKVNVPVAFAEARKTSDMIFDVAKRIDRAYRAFRKGNLKGVAENLNITPKRLHKSWLEYKYGWMPLLMDVKGSAEFFAQQNIVRKPKFVVTATEELVKSNTVVVDDFAYGGSPQHNAWTIFVSGHRKVRVKIWCELDHPHVSAMQQLGLTNPALVAWELIPFSFVFDWFISVGDYLTAMTSLNGVVVKRAMWSVVDSKGYTQSRPASSQIKGAVTYVSNGDFLSGSKRDYDRQSFVPDPLYLIPQRGKGLNFDKLITSLALIRGQYRGDRSGFIRT